MKRAIGIALLAAFLVSISGCANTERQTTEERTVSESSAMSDEESSGAMESREPEKNRTVSFSDSKESSKESTAAAETESSAVETELAASETMTPAAESKTTESQSPPAEESRSPQTEHAKADESEPPSTPQPESAEKIPSEAPTTAPSEEAPAKESTPQPAEEPAAPEFDIQMWIDYAAEYAGNVGLNLSPDATACWDNPITAGSHSLYLERDIQSRLNRYSRDAEITDVWIWAEERSDGSYDLYIGYA